MDIDNRIPIERRQHDAAAIVGRAMCNPVLIVIIPRIDSHMGIAVLAVGKDDNIPNFVFNLPCLIVLWDEAVIQPHL